LWHFADELQAHHPKAEKIALKTNILVKACPVGAPLRPLYLALTGNRLKGLELKEAATPLCFFVLGICLMIGSAPGACQFPD